MMKLRPESPRALQGVPKPVRIGFIPLVDCAPLLVARELDLFRQHNVQVEFSCEVGWATIREKLIHGQVDAAHAVAGLAFALGLGLGSPSFRVVAPFIFNLHGNAITLSTDLWKRGVRDAASLKMLVRSTTRKLTFAMVSAFSTHHMLLRLWLASGGINPDRDVLLVTLPPTQMAPSLQAGLVDGFCVGEPWNSVAVEAGSGWVVATSEDLAPNHPEKVLLVGEHFAEQHPRQVASISSALRAACEYSDRPENRPHVARILHESGYFRCGEAMLRRSLVGPFLTGTGRKVDSERFHIFSRHLANDVTLAKGQWVKDQLIQIGVIPAARGDEAEQVLRRCWRESTLATDVPVKLISRPAAKQPVKRSKKPKPTYA